MAPSPQPETPLWAHVPETISPEWEAIFTEKGQCRADPMPDPGDVDGWKVLQTAYDGANESAALPKAACYGVTYEEIEIAGIPAVMVSPSTPLRDDKLALYLHGGGYVVNSAKAAIESAFLVAASTGLKVMAVDYTLAPHSRWQATTDEVVAVLQELEARGVPGQDILLYGDSAGGGLAAGVTLKLRDLGLQLPAALVLWSPWADLTETGDTYLTLHDAEPCYTYQQVLRPCALAYADPNDQRHPYVSPVYGDFSKGFPPTLIQGGTREIFLSNCIRLYQALDQAGQIVKLDIYEGMPHVFQSTLPATRESKAAMKKVAKWAAEYVTINEPASQPGVA